MAMSTITEITTEAEFNSHLSSLPPSALVIMSFHTPWAAPCAQMATVLKTLAASYPANDPPSTSWLSLNAEDLPEISDTYDVTAVPFLVLVRDKVVLETVSGSDAGKVRSAIEKYANASTTKARNVTDQLPPLQKVAPKQSNGTVAKDLSSYTLREDDPAMAPRLGEEEATGQKEDLQKRLTDLVKAAPVMLFMKGTPSSPQCGFSRQLVALLREKSIRYGFFNILADDEVRQGLKEFADWPTFPQLWIDGELVGGLDIVKEEFANDSDFLKSYSVKTASSPSLTSEKMTPVT